MKRTSSDSFTADESSVHSFVEGLEMSGLWLVLVRSPGFEPGSSAWEADVLARLDYDRQSMTR